MLLSYIKRGAYNTIIFSISSSIVRVVSFLFLPYFLSHLSLTEFGIWDFYQLFFSLGTQILSSCAAISLVRFYLLYKDEPEKQRKATGNALLFVALCAIIFPCCLALVFPYLKILPASYNYVYSTLLSISFFALFSILIAFLRVKEKFGYYLIFFSGQSILAVLLTVLGINFKYGITAFFYANCFSFFIFIPFFIYLLKNNWDFSLEIFKKQLSYSLPILLSSFLYTGFFTIDRLFLKNTDGYDTLGAYGLLWRFGNIFQILSIAMMDASPIIFYNAQKEKNSDFLISKLISYFCIILTSSCLLAIIIARWVIGFIFPYKYHFLIYYLPAFFFPLIILEIARLFQIGFGLATKTVYMPLLSLIILSIQALSLYCFQAYSIWGLLMANSIAFFSYAVLSYLVSSKIYQRKIIEYEKISIVGIFFTLYLVLFNFLFMCSIPWYYLLVIICSWPLLLWHSNCITNDEKNWLRAYLKTLIKNFIKSFFAQTVKTETSFDTILYLRTDICSQEITTGGSITHTLGVINGFINTKSKIICASSAMPSIVSKLDTISFKKLTVWPLFFFMRWKLGYLRWHLDCFFSTFFFAFQINKLFKQNSITMIYQRYSLLNFTGVLLSWFKKVPLILEYNGSEVWVFRVWAEKQWLHLMGIAKLVEYINLYAADHIIVVSQALKDELIVRDIDARKILINPNGVDVEQFNPANLEIQRDTLRKQYGITDKFVFGFIGTFSYWHGIEMLAKIIPGVIQQQSNAHFMLIGDGTLKHYLENELKQQNIDSTHVTFTGKITHNKAKDFLATCDAFLSPTQPNSDGTRFFGSPTKIFEYLSMAKPVIASDLEQLAEVIFPALKKEHLTTTITIDNELGFLIPSDDINSFTQALIIIANLSKVNLHSMGINARKKAIENYTWVSHVKRIQEFIHNQYINHGDTYYAKRTSKTRNI